MPSESLRIEQVAQAVLVLIVLIVFWPVFGHGFVDWDDNVNIYQNPHLNPVTGRGLARLWRRPYAGLYVPLAYTVWAGLACLGSEPVPNPTLFHVANWVCHAGCVLVVFRLLLRVLDGSSSGNGRTGPAREQCWAAGLGALLFGLHPMQAEPVAWVTGLKDVLGGLLVCLSLLCFLHGFDGDTGGQARVRVRGPWTIAATALFLLALTAKPAAVVVPLAAVLLCWARGKTAVLRGRAARLTLGFWLVAAGAWVALTRASQQTSEYTVPVSIPMRPLIALDALAFYLYKLLWPVRLGPDYGRAPSTVLRHAWGYLTWLVPAGLALMLFLWHKTARDQTVRRDLRRIAAAAGLSGVLLLPVLGLVPFAFQAFSTVADRYAYAAMLGPALAVAVGSRRLLSGGAGGSAQSRRLVVCAALVFVALGARTRWQAGQWAGTRTLFTHALRVNPRSSRMFINMGNALRYEGRTAEAIAQFSNALRVRPGFAEAHNNLGIAFAELGDLRQAETHYRRAVRVRPGYAEAHDNLGIALGRQGRFAEAITHFSRAVQIRPDFSDAYRNLAVAFRRAGRSAAAVAACSQGLRAGGPGVALLCELGDGLADLARWDEALAHYSRALGMAPNRAQTHANIGVLLDHLGRVHEARAHYSMALRLDPQNAEAFCNLGLSLEEEGRRQEAALCFRRALRLEPDLTEAKEGLRRCGGMEL